MDIEEFQPSLAVARAIHNQATSKSPRPTLLPISISTSSDLLTPITVFLKLSSGYGSDSDVMPRSVLILAELLPTTVFYSRVLRALPRQLADTATLELVSLCTWFRP